MVSTSGIRGQRIASGNVILRADLGLIGMVFMPGLGLFSSGEEFR